MSRLPIDQAAACAASVRRAGVRFAVLAALSVGSALAQPISPAEALLFETDHLARTKVPATLVYEFRHLSNVEPAFTDSVELEVSRSKDKGQVHAALRFLTGARMHTLPEVDDAHGNPVLLGFLEHDIAEMRRLTGGSVTYFRKRIRMALANSAQVTPQRISYGGKTVDGKAVRIQPYLDDPLHARFEHYVRKSYTFVLSDDVPGGIYQVRTSLANTGANQPAPGTVVARTAAPGAAASTAPPGTARPGAATPGKGRPDKGTPDKGADIAVSPNAAGKSGMQPPPAAGNAAQPGRAASGAAPPSGGVSSAAQVGQAAPGAAMPVIDETLTLVKVVAPQR
jgi:hypothetical protein